MRRFLSALIALIAVVGVSTTAQAAETAYPSHPFTLTYGNTYTTGTVTFYNRVVRVSGTHRALSSSGCRWTMAGTYASRNPRLTDPVDPFLGFGRTPDPVCAATQTFSFDVDADISGGAGSVMVEFWAQVGDAYDLKVNLLIRR